MDRLAWLMSSTRSFSIFQVLGLRAGDTLRVVRSRPCGPELAANDEQNPLWTAHTERRRVTQNADRGVRINRLHGEDSERNMRDRVRFHRTW